MQKDSYLHIIFTCCFFLLCACSPSFSPVMSESDVGINDYELIIAKEMDILGAASDAIHACFPDAVVSGVGGKEKGFVFNKENFSDSPLYKLLIRKAYGTAADGNDIVGYRYSIYVNGAFRSPEASDVQPLITRFKKILADRGIELIRVHLTKTR